MERVLRDSGRTAAGSRRNTRLRRLLVGCQVALALVLLISAGLLFQSFWRLRSVHLGLEPANVTTFEVHLPGGRYADPSARSRFHADLHARTARLTGVTAAGAVSRLPFTGTFHRWGTRRLDLPPESGSLQPEQRVIEGDYFAALGVPLLQGRLFGPRDDEHAPRRVVVSRELVRQLFAGEDPIGRQIRVAGQTAEIIGIVGDVPIAARAPLRPTVYHRHAQFAGNRNWALTQVVATAGPSPGLLADIRRELAQIDPDLVLYESRMLEDVIGSGVAQERFAMVLIGAFAALAVLLAAIGIYGVLSYAAAMRRREIGIRLALGAQLGSVRALVLRDGAVLAVAGVAAGLAAAYVATRWLESLLYEVSSSDPFVFAGAAAVLLAVAIAASWLPARAVTRDAVTSILGE
jgi:predicted permease